MKVAHNFSIAFAAGAVGGLLVFLLLSLCFHNGLFEQIGVSFPFPPFWSIGALHVLNHHIVQGGAWGLLFAFPILGKSSPWVRALLIGLFPSLVTLFYVFPFVQMVGLMGKSYGQWMFAVVLVMNWVWALIAALWYQGMSK